MRVRAANSVSFGIHSLAVFVERGAIGSVNCTKKKKNHRAECNVELCEGYPGNPMLVSRFTGANISCLLPLVLSESQGVAPASESSVSSGVAASALR
jgi:hypothetical protein